MFKLTAGLAIGYVLGSRAGRDKYEQIAATARKVQAHPAVTQARQTVRARLGAAADAPTTPAIVEPPA
jgi:hypothetical protein